MLIKEVLIENESFNPEEKFGRILFGDWQYDIGLTKELEKDTEYEQKIYGLLMDWFRHGVHKEDIHNAIIELSKLKDDYPTLLKPDTFGKSLYRSMVGANGLEPKDNDNFIYHSQHICESWSTSYQYARRFAENTLKELSIREDIEIIIIEADVPKNERIFNISFTNKFSGLNENEVVRISDKPIKCEILDVFQPENNYDDEEDW